MKRVYTFVKKSGAVECRTISARPGGAPEIHTGGAEDGALAGAAGVPARMAQAMPREHGDEAGAETRPGVPARVGHWLGAEAVLAAASGHEHQKIEYIGKK